MGNCLKTQLKANIQNELLPDFGYQLIELFSEGSVNYDISELYRNSGKTVYLKGDAYFTNNNGDNLGKSSGAVADVAIHLNGGKVLFELPDGLYTGNTLAYFKLKRNNNVVCNFDTSVFRLLQAASASNFGVTYFYIETTTIKGKLSDLFNTPIKNGLSEFVVSPSKLSPDFTGSIDDITIDSNYGTKTYAFELKNVPSITGELKTLIDKIAACTGRSLTTTGTASSVLSIQFVNTPLVTFNGTSIGNVFNKKYIVYPDGSYVERTT